MRCPYCSHEETQVAETRDSEEGFTRRRRRCLKCDRRFTTYERPEVAMPTVVKRDGGRVEFDPAKLRASMMLALRSDAVRMDQAQNFRSTAQDRAERFEILGNGKSAKLGWQMQDYNRHGAAGNAAAATVAKGQALLAASGLALAQLLGEIDRLPPDTLNDRLA